MSIATARVDKGRHVDRHKSLSGDRPVHPVVPRRSGRAFALVPPIAPSSPSSGHHPIAIHQTICNIVPAPDTADPAAPTIITSTTFGGGVWRGPTNGDPPAAENVDRPRTVRYMPKAS